MRCKGRVIALVRVNILLAVGRPSESLYNVVSNLEYKERNGAAKFGVSTFTISMRNFDIN